MPENFPKHVRAGYLASAYAVAVSVFGGTSQLVVAWLIKATGNTMAPAWYMIGCVIVSLIAVSMLEETGDVIWTRAEQAVSEAAGWGVR